MQAPHTKGSFVLNSSLPTYVGLATLAVFIVALLYAANWASPLNWGKSATAAPKDLGAYIAQLNMSIADGMRHAPADFANELSHSSLFLLLAPKGSTFALPYVLKNGALSLPRDQGATTTLSYSFSQDGSRLTFLALSATDENSVRDTPWVYQENDAQLKDTAIPYDFSNGPEIVDKLSTRYMLGATISNNGNILFSGLPSQSTTWSIYQVKMGTPAHVIAEGFSPKWISDSEFVYLKTDGLYGATLTDPEGRLLVAAQKPLMPNNTIDISNRIDVSADGNTLIWSRPDTGAVDIFDITHDGVAKISLRGTVRVDGDAVLLSPHASYFAINEQQPQQQIAFYDLSTLSKVNFEIPLDFFEMNPTELDDWVIRP